jgi:glycogen debranching enzyme
MFRTFRQKLLFWFLFFIASSLSYSRDREAVAEILRQVESAYTTFLQGLKVQTDFVGAEATHEDFLTTGQSPGLRQRDV